MSCCGWRVADDLFGFRIERSDLARRRAERFVYHSRPQQVEAGGYPLGLLQDQAIEIAATDEFLDGGGALGTEPQRLQRLTSEYERRFIGFAQLEIDPLSEKLQGMSPIERAHIKSCAGKFGVNEVDDTARGPAVIDAYRDQSRLPPAFRAEDIQPGAIAVIDPATKTGGAPRHVWIRVDGRDMDAFCKQALGNDLAEAPKPDN